MARLKPREAARWVACIIWLEDLEKVFPENPYGRLIGYLAGLNVKVAISPIHDRDVYEYEDVEKWKRNHIDPDYYDYIENEEEFERRKPRIGDPKKPHIHVEFRLQVKRNRDFLTNMMEPLVFIPPSKWERVDDFDTYLCYLCHMFNKEKAQYKATDIILLGGLDGSALLQTTEDQKDKLYDNIFEVIEDKRMRYYYQLVRWAKDCGDMKMKAIIRGNPASFNSYFRSMREHKFDKAEAKKAGLRPQY